MRLSINLRDEFYRAAQAFSKAEDVSLSEAVNRMIAIGFQKEEGSRQRLPSGKSADGARSFPVSRGSRLVTAERVRSIEEDA